MAKSRSPRRAVRIVLVIALVSATLLIQPAQANAGVVAAQASGGGCSGYAGLQAWLLIKACISSPSRGAGLPDAYFTIVARHPPCTITVRAVRVGDRRTMSTVHYPCPTVNVTSPRRILGSRFSATSGQYVAYVSVSTHIAGVYSPRLTLP